MSKTNKTEQRKKAMLEALQKSLGVVTQACQMAGVSRTQFYQWCKDDPVYELEVQEVGEMAIDFAESKLYKLVESGNVTAILFTLKTKGKNRGWVERQEFTQEPAKVIDWQP